MTRWTAVLASGATVALTLVTAGIPAAQAALGSVTEYTATGATPLAISTGADGNLWFADLAGNNIGRITPTGTVTDFPIPTANAFPRGITAGPDGNMWFTEYSTAKIGRVTPSGSVTEYPLPQGSQPDEIAAGPDGNLWAADSSGKIDRLTPGGTVTQFSVPTSPSIPYGLAAGPDGNLWFTEISGDKIGRITPTGSLTEYPVPTVGAQPETITAGPDGNLWFTEGVGNKIGRITPTGTITEFGVPTASASPRGITAGSDGNVWFTELSGDSIGRITPTGSITEYPLSTPNAQPEAITAGPDGNIWFAESNASKIGELSTPSAATQQTSVTVTGGVLSVALANPTVTFSGLANSPLTPGTQSIAAQIGVISYNDTLGDGLPWTSTVAATDLVAVGSSPFGTINAANMTYSPGASITPTSGGQPAAGSGGAFSYASACPDLAPGVSMSCPLALASATAATAQGAFTQSESTVTLRVPIAQPPGSYSGLLQYTING